MEIRLDDVQDASAAGRRLGRVSALSVRFRATLGGVEIANNAHDIFIDLLAKTGALGMAILCVRSCYVAGSRGARAADAGAHFRLALLGVLMMHALVEYPQQYMFFLMPAMLVFGLLETRPLRLVARPLSYGVYVVLVFGGLAALYPAYARLQPRRSAVLRLASRRAVSRAIRRSCSRRGANTARRRCCR